MSDYFKWVVGGLTEVTTKQRGEGLSGRPLPIPYGKAFLVEGTTGAKALRSDPCLMTLENVNSLLSSPFSLPKLTSTSGACPNTAKSVQHLSS